MARDDAATVPSFLRFDLVVPAASVGACQSIGTRLLLQGASEIRMFGRLRSSPRSFGWQSFQVPPRYLSSGDCSGGCWPIRHCAASDDGMFLAVAGATGFAVLSKARKAGGRSRIQYSRIAATVNRRGEGQKPARGRLVRGSPLSQVRELAERSSERDLSTGRLPLSGGALLSTASGSSHRKEGWRLFADEWEEATLCCEALCWCRRDVDLRGMSPCWTKMCGISKNGWALLALCRSTESSQEAGVQEYTIFAFGPDHLSLSRSLDSQELPPGHRPILVAVSLLCELRQLFDIFFIT